MPSICNLSEQQRLHTARVAAALLLLVTGAGAEAPRSATQEQLRPVLIYQVAQYVNWPVTKTTADEGLRFCILDDPGLADALAAVVRGKSIQDRALTVGKVKNSTELVGCQIVFISSSKQKSLREFFAHWSYPPSLMVGEAEGFAEMGGMINLKVSEGRVGLQINLASTEKAGLKVRSQLLQLAQIVSGAGVR